MFSVRKKQLSNKAQLNEMVGFAIIVIAVTLAIVLFRLFIVSGSAESLSIVSERHESERLRSGINALFSMTENRSGVNLLSMLGIAAGLRSDVVNLGPTIGPINVTEELIWRMDALFEPGHWYIFVPFPEKEAGIEIIIIADTSGSMKDDIDNLKNNVPKIITDLQLVGKKARATLYLLQGGGSVYDCTLINETKYFKCKSIEYIMNKVTCAMKGQTSEDWGNGISCASEYGPEGRWTPGAVRIGIVLSDELSGGSEQCCSITSGCSQAQAVDNGINGAKANNVTVFALRADPCGWETPAGSIYCSCGTKELPSFMEKLANDTGGKMYLLTDSKGVSESVEDIIRSINVTNVSGIYAGTQVPTGIRVRAFEVLVPVPTTGEYTKAYIYQWS